MSASEFDSRFFHLDRHADVAVATFLPAKLTDEDNIERLGQERHKRRKSSAQAADR